MALAEPLLLPPERAEEEMRMRELPIGYWVKRVDELLTEELGAALAHHGLDRFRWQLLNSLADAGAAPVAALRLRAFVDDAALDAMVNDLVGRGWVVTDADGLLSLTASGSAAHVEALREATESRRRSTDGISTDDYATTVATLQRIAANLGHCEP